jgi:hypothetical protein
VIVYITIAIEVTNPGTLLPSCIMNTAKPSRNNRKRERDEKCTQSSAEIPEGNVTPHIDGRIIIRWTLLEQEKRRGLYRVIQEELPPLTELISDDILRKNCHINVAPIHNIYRVTFIFRNALL